MISVFIEMGMLLVSNYYEGTDLVLEFNSLGG